MWSSAQAVQATSIRVEALSCTGGVVNRTVNVKGVLQYTYGETGSSLSRCSLADVSLEGGIFWTTGLSVCLFLALFLDNGAFYAMVT